MPLRIAGRRFPFEFFGKAQLRDHVRYHPLNLVHQIVRVVGQGLRSVCGRLAVFF
jgi:hypothetical protein